MAVSISTIIAGDALPDISMLEAVELLRPDLVAAEIAYSLRGAPTYFSAIRGIYSDLLVPYLPVRSRRVNTVTKLQPADIPGAYGPIRGRDIILHPAPKYKLQIQTATGSIVDTSVSCKVAQHIGNNRFVVVVVPYNCYLDVAADVARLSTPMSASMMDFLRSTRYISTLSCGLRLFSRGKFGDTTRYVLVDLDRERAIYVRVISSSQVLEYSGDY